MTSVILAIDTATPAVTAGLVLIHPASALSGPRVVPPGSAGTGAGRLDVLAARVTVDPRLHAEALTPNVLAALADAGLGMADLDAVVVGCGPGPFTGLRVGMATAAAFGHALGISVHGVCSLDAIGVRTCGLCAGEVLVVTDARRREVYWARYRDGIRVAGPAVNAPADVPVGDAVAVAGAAEQAALFDMPRLEPVYPTVAGLVRAGELAGTDWAAAQQPLVPLYLRRPDADLPRQDGDPRMSGVGRSSVGSRGLDAGSRAGQRAATR
jgi:tRNA threonylcarbamoyl adenosine modification protein YeaZ